MADTTQKHLNYKTADLMHTHKKNASLGIGTPNEHLCYTALFFI